MIVSYLKNFITTRIVKKGLSNGKCISSENSIQSVGLLLDEGAFFEKNALLEELVRNGIQKHQIKVLIFKDKINKHEVFDAPFFCSKDLSWSATFDKLEVNTFLDQHFDLLINYYDVEKTPLVVVSNASNANFKVGFSSVDERLNHFMIKASVGDYSLFVAELFKYLKILNKI